MKNNNNRLCHWMRINYQNAENLFRSKNYVRLFKNTYLPFETVGPGGLNATEYFACSFFSSQLSLQFIESCSMLLEYLSTKVQFFGQL